MRDFIVPSGASYTEFLRDYLVNNQLPNTLSQNDDVFDVDFKALFESYYLMREIGFDSEEMFKQKLNSKIDVVMPLYKKKFEELQALENQVFNNGYTITQTNNLAHNETLNEDKDATRTDNLTQGVSGTTSRDMINTKNLTDTSNDNESITHIDYKTPVGASSASLPASSISGGYTDNKTKTNATKTQTGTDTIDEDLTNSQTTINTGTVRNIENNDTQHNTTDTGTITTVYTKSPRFNSVDALKAFKEDFEDVIVECLKAFDDLFMQVF